MKLVDALIDTLCFWETEYVFGVSGANIEHVHDAIHRQSKDKKITSIFAKSEVGAAFMADGYARRHRRLGVCCSTSGGGMMNLAVGIAESFAESVPILALIGQAPMELEGRGAFQDSSGKSGTIDAQELFKAMAKFTARLDDPQTFWQTLEQAGRSAVNGRPGPAVLLIPRNVNTWEVSIRPPDFPTSLQALRQSSKPCTADIDELQKLLHKSKCPVLLFGTGVSRSAKFKTVIDFGILSKIPVVSTMADPGIYPNDAPNYLGMVGCTGHPSAHDFLNNEADCIVVVGCGLNVMVRNPIEKALKRAAIAIVNIDPNPILSIIEPSVVVPADAGSVFEELNQRQGLSCFFSAPLDDYRLTHVRKTAKGRDASDLRLAPSDVVPIIQDYLKTTRHIIFDAGNCPATVQHYLRIPRETTTNIALGFGGMGYAIPAAIGATIGVGFDHTMVVCGDGAFLMLGMEVHTAVEYGLPILFIVFNNAGHGMCKTRQELFFDGRLECSLYGSFDAAKTAKSLANKSTLWTGHAKTADDVRRLLFEYHSKRSHLPGLLDISVSSDELPPFAPFLSPQEKSPID